MVLVAVFLEDPGHRVSIEVGDDPVRIGRSPEARGREQVLAIPWKDRIISRNHAVAHREGSILKMVRLPATARHARPNRFFTNAPHAERKTLTDPLLLEAGDSFSIGAQGRTAFFWLESLDDLAAAMAQQKPFGGLPEPELRPELRKATGYDEVDDLDDYSVRLQLKLLQQELPDKVLSDWTTEEELLTRAADFLKTALPGQRGVSVAFVALQEEAGTRTFEILNQDPSSRADFRVSGKLLQQIQVDSSQANDVYLWNSNDGLVGKISHSSLLTEVNWVAVMPVSSADENPHIYHEPGGRPVYIYVEARQSASSTASSFVPFIRLISSLVASLLASREQQRVQDQLSEHFSPALRRILQEGEVHALKPTLAECTVLFCDRRSSSRLMETALTDDDVLSQLRDNQEIMSVISQTVFEHDGVITDFAGDGVLALWGWPMATEDHALQAVRAAESIATRLSSRVEISSDGHRVSTIRMGISTGRIAVGDTGPRQQVHISVFGRVVNFGARLEALGKQFHVPTLLSEETANFIQTSGKRLRKLCYLKPAGFEGAYPIHELVLPMEVGGSGASLESIEIYEQALGHFLEREWDRCQELLDQLPDHDEPAHWLHQQVDFLRLRPPAADWEGEITSLTK